MKELNFPAYHFKTIIKNGEIIIFDVFRKKNVVLTPEEWVRQHALKYLVEEKRYPSGLLAVEKAITFNGMQKRCDAVFYNQQKKPLLIIECKAPDVEINQVVFEQALRYNLSLNVTYLFITNGLKHFFFKINSSGLSAMQKIPNWDEL